MPIKAPPATAARRRRPGDGGDVPASQHGGRGRDRGGLRRRQGEQPGTSHRPRHRRRGRFRHQRHTSLVARRSSLTFVVTPRSKGETAWPASFLPSIASTPVVATSAKQTINETSHAPIGFERPRMPHPKSTKAPKKAPARTAPTTSPAPSTVFLPLWNHSDRASACPLRASRPISSERRATRFPAAAPTPGSRLSSLVEPTSATPLPPGPPRSLSFAPLRAEYTGDECDGCDFPGPSAPAAAHEAVDGGPARFGTWQTRHRPARTRHRTGRAQ